MLTRIAVVGLGKLGASMAAAFASRGFPVVGVDVDAAAVERLNDGQAPVQETDLGRYIAEHHARLRATTSHAEAVRASDVSFVIVPTPSDERGAFSLRYAAEAFASIGRALADSPDYHLVVLTSTVLPGAMRHVLLPILERTSGKQAGRDFGLCYSPEFIALGSVIADFLNPDFTLVGELDARSGTALADLYARALIGDPPCRRMSLENAELTKVALNAYVTTKITFANMLADLCEQLPGGDVDVVTAAIGTDSRIGRKYLRGALGFGGPCFPRDNAALAYFADAVGARADLAETTDRRNRSRADAVAGLVAAALPAGATVAVLGLAYKPFSDVVEESQGLRVAEQLAAAGLRVLACDPLVPAAAVTAALGAVTVHRAPAECVQEADAVVVATPDPAFAALAPSLFARTAANPRLVVDCWRLLRDPLEHLSGVRYVAIGLARDDEANAARLGALWTSTDSP